MKTLVPEQPALFNDFKRRRTRGQRARLRDRRWAIRRAAVAGRLRQLGEKLSRG